MQRWKNASTTLSFSSNNFRSTKSEWTCNVNLTENTWLKTCANPSTKVSMVNGIELPVKKWKTTQIELDLAMLWITGKNELTKNLMNPKKMIIVIAN